LKPKKKEEKEVGENPEKEKGRGLYTG